MTSVNVLILGAGWTSTFLIPLLNSAQLSYAATTRAGSSSPPTIPFTFDPSPSALPDPYRALPDAETIIITFPIKDTGASERLVKLYEKTHPLVKDVLWIQLGSTGMWDSPRHKPPGAPVAHNWYDRHSPFTPDDPRALAEEELLKLPRNSPGLGVRTTVLDLAGLWGGLRHPRKWVGRVVPTKDALKAKGSVHFIHGYDIARAILAVHNQPEKADGQRWILTDGRVYDWWDLASAWGSPASGALSPNESEENRGPQAQWVRELMEETGVRALPRDIELLGRALDSREFWSTFGLSPVMARLETDART